MENFIKSIMSNLEGSGFPEKKVSLPTEKMFEIADNKGLSLNKVLEEMEQQNGVVSDIGTEKIIFSQSQPDVSADPFSGMDQAQMMEKAQAMMAQMDPAELKKMQEMFLNMSDDEKQDMMKKGKDLGII
jgi:hypothetical protein